MIDNFDYGEYANNIHEASKNDQIIIVGSQIRQAIHAAFTKGQIDGRKHQAEVDADIAEKSHITSGAHIGPLFNTGWVQGCDAVAEFIRTAAKQIGVKP